MPLNSSLDASVPAVHKESKLTWLKYMAAVCLRLQGTGQDSHPNKQGHAQNGRYMKLHFSTLRVSQTVLTMLGGHEHAQAAYGPLHALALVKVGCMLLDGHIGEVDEGVVDVLLFV